MHRFRTRFLYCVERGRPLRGTWLRLGRLGTFVWVKPNGR
jgi:hypothetical protein